VAPVNVAPIVKTVPSVKSRDSKMPVKEIFPVGNTGTVTSDGCDIPENRLAFVYGLPHSRVLYNNNYGPEIAGFQFDLVGATIDDAGGGRCRGRGSQCFQWR